MASLLDGLLYSCVAYERLETEEWHHDNDRLVTVSSELMSVFPITQGVRVLETEQKDGCASHVSLDVRPSFFFGGGEQVKQLYARSTSCQDINAACFDELHSCKRCCMAAGWFLSNDVRYQKCIRYYAMLYISGVLGIHCILKKGVHRGHTSAACILWGEWPTTTSKRQREVVT